MTQKSIFMGACALVLVLSGMPDLIGTAAMPRTVALQLTFKY